MNNLFDNDTLLARWLSGELSEEERQALERHPDFPAFQRLVAATDKLALPDARVQAMWEKFSQQIENQPKKKPAIRRSMIWLLAAAASIAGLLFFARPFFRSGPGSETAVSTGIGEQKTVTLPDGSKLRLNAVSSVGFYVDDWSNKRVVTMQGEVFFDVKKSGTSFIAETPLGKIEVLGTTFTIKSRDTDLNVACFTGKVKASTPQGAAVILTAGQKSRTVQNTWAPVRSIAETAPDWAKGESRFDNEPLPAVFAEIERQYGISIQAPASGDRIYSGTFPHNNLDLALRLVCDPMNLSYRIEGKVVFVQPK